MKRIIVGIVLLTVLSAHAAFVPPVIENSRKAAVASWLPGAGTDAGNIAKIVIEYARPCRVRAQVYTYEHGLCTFEFCWEKGLRTKKEGKPWFRIAQPHDILRGNPYRQVAVNITSDGRAGVCVSKDKDGYLPYIRTYVLYDGYLRRGLSLISCPFVAQESGDLVGIHLGNALGKNSGIAFENYFFQTDTVSSKYLENLILEDGVRMAARLGSLRREISLSSSDFGPVMGVATGVHTLFLRKNFDASDSWMGSVALGASLLMIGCRVAGIIEFSNHLKECKKKLKKSVIKTVLANNS